jgi:RES domain-containing protein
LQLLAPSSVTTLWRISSHADLTGEGGRLTSARWHTEGKRVVYLAESPVGAIVERLVHLMDVKPEGILPRTYQLLRISIGAASEIKLLEPSSGINWKLQEEVTRKIGDAWLTLRETVLARVPSVIAPYTWNYLLNPEHPDAKRVTIAEVIRERFDNRLFRFGTH